MVVHIGFLHINLTQILKMQKIFMPLGNGQAIMPEVMEGILKQTIKCVVVPITSEKTDNKENCSGNLNNWLTILELTKNKPFIGMDSDVVMTDTKTIKTLINIPEDVDISAIMTQKKQHNISHENKIMVHSLFYCKIPDFFLRWFKRFKKDNFKMCCWCEALYQLLKKDGSKYRVFKDPKATECKRL